MTGYDRTGQDRTAQHSTGHVCTGPCSAVQGRGGEGQTGSLLHDFCSLPVHISISWDTRTHTRTCTLTHTHTHTYKYSNTHTHTHTHKHAHAHAHICRQAEEVVRSGVAVMKCSGCVTGPDPLSSLFYSPPLFAALLYSLCYSLPIFSTFCFASLLSSLLCSPLLYSSPPLFASVLSSSLHLTCVTYVRTLHCSLLPEYIILIHMNIHHMPPARCQKFNTCQSNLSIQPTMC